MIKKVVLAVLVLGLAGGGFFYWWNSQSDVRELNKTLPDGVRGVKGLIGKEYKVINKIDGYEFKVPAEWRGVKEIEYMPERTEDKYTGTSVNLEGKEGSATIFAIDQFRVENVILKIWAEKFFNIFELVGDFSEDIVGEFEVVKTQESIHVGGMWVYFFKKGSSIYSITNGSEDFIRYIITNDKW